MKKTTVITAILVAAIGITCFTACAKKTSSGGDGGTGTAVEENGPDEDDGLSVEEHNRKVLAEELKLNKNSDDIDGIIVKLEHIESGKISDVKYVADRTQTFLYFTGEDGTNYRFYLVNEKNYGVMACQNLDTNEFLFASYA